MKKLFALILAIIMVTVFASCSSTPQSTGSGSNTSSNQNQAASTNAAQEKKPVELIVVTSYGGDDGNRQNYEKAYKAYEAASGNTVKDASGTSNEEWKARIMADFETGAEPDILFYFTGVDANKIIEGNKVVTIDEIRAVYPDYASNMKDGMLPKSPVNSKQYAIPVNGYWEGLFVNKKVLADCGVEVPGPNTTWEQFLADCQKIADKGYIPIAASLQEVPHYWFEFCVFNHTNVDTHTIVPASATDAAGKAWSAGLYDIKEMFELGYFPQNTNTATDPETNVLMTDNKAAFMIDGSWKMGWFTDNAENIDDFTVTYVPGAGDRKSTDIIGGLSMGYYITRKAWDNPEKQAACVEFIKAMTTDEVVNTFGATAITALKNGTVPPSDANSLIQDALVMTKGSTGVAGATQDGLSANARGDLFSNVKNIVTGSMTAEEAVESALSIKD